MRKAKKIMDEVREVMRLHYYSIHTERSYCDWIKRLSLFIEMNIPNNTRVRLILNLI